MVRPTRINRHAVTMEWKLSHAIEPGKLNLVPQRASVAQSQVQRVCGPH
jgi:hypothetical protein